VDVLQAFRKNHPAHELQPEITKKIAYTYREAGKLTVAAAEYERIEKESKDDEVRRGALLVAADLYEQTQDTNRALDVYRRYVAAFPKPLNWRWNRATRLPVSTSPQRHQGLLRRAATDHGHGRPCRTRSLDRTRFLGANAALGLTEPLYEQLTAIKLVKPFDKNLLKKKAAMKAATDGFSKLVKYEVGDVTARQRTTWPRSIITSAGR